MGGDGERLRFRDLTTTMPSSSEVTSCSGSVWSESSSLMATAESTNGDAVLPVLRRMGRPVFVLYETAAGWGWSGLEPATGWGLAPLAMSRVAYEVMMRRREGVCEGIGRDRRRRRWQRSQEVDGRTSERTKQDRTRLAHTQLEGPRKGRLNSDSGLMTAGTTCRG